MSKYEKRYPLCKGKCCQFNARFRVAVASLGFVVATCTGIAHAQQDSENRAGFVRWAKTHAIPLRTVEPEKDVSDLRPLKAILGNARVVALGEPAHGVHEPLAFRNRLFRFLVEEMGFTAIALESGFAESRRVADFVAGGPGIAEQVIGGPENQELVRWMREYNADAAHPRKIRFYGMDLGLGGMGNSYPTPIPIKEALSYLARVDASSERRLSAALEPYLSRLPGDKPPAFSAAEHDALTASIEDLIALLERERPAFVATTSATDYEWAHRNAIVARQANRVFRVNPTDVQPGKIPPAAWKAVSTRDAAMADNVRWVQEREGSQGRVLVFAHNGHVKNARTEGGDWSVFERSPNVMGQYLRAALGSDLVIIGISAARDTVIPQEKKPAPNRLDAVLAEVGRPCFLLDLRASRTDRAAAAWLAEPQTMTANLVSFMTLPPGTAFDLLLFVEKLTPPR